MNAKRTTSKASPRRASRALKGAALGVVLSALANVAPARADFPYAFVEITCAPELHFAAVRRFWVYNLDEARWYAGQADARLRAAQLTIERKRHVFTSRALTERPQTCEIPALVSRGDTLRPAFSLSITAQVDKNPQALSYRMLRDHVEVRLSGERVANLGMNPYGLSQGDESVEVSTDGVGLMIRACSLREADGKEILTCTRVHRPAP